MQINPYLVFNGNCREAFKVYADILGGKIEAQSTFGDAPKEAQQGPDMQDKIMHVRLIAKGATLMGSDSPPQYFKPAGGMSVSVNVDTVEEAERIYAGLSDGAHIGMPLQQTFWAARFGMLTDRFGTPWMINCETKQS